MYVAFTPLPVSVPAPPDQLVVAALLGPDQGVDSSPNTPPHRDQRSPWGGAACIDDAVPARTRSYGIHHGHRVGPAPALTTGVVAARLLQLNW